MKLLENWIIDEHDSKEDSEIISFGLEMMQTAIIVIIISIALGILMGQTFQGLMLLFVMIPLRQNAGGLHLKTRIGCAILSVIIFITALFCMRYLTVPPLMQIFVHLVASFILIMFAPVDNEKNELEDIEKKVYGDRARKILAFESILFYLLIMLKLPDWSFVILLGILICAILIVLGLIKNQLGLE